MLLFYWHLITPLPEYFCIVIVIWKFFYFAIKITYTNATPHRLWSHGHKNWHTTSRLFTSSKKKHQIPKSLIWVEQSVACLWWAIVILAGTPCYKTVSCFHSSCPSEEKVLTAQWRKKVRSLKRCFYRLHNLLYLLSSRPGTDGVAQTRAIQMLKYHRDTIKKEDEKETSKDSHTRTCVERNTHGYMGQSQVQQAKSSLLLHFNCVQRHSCT